jgi:hypothetical protein
MHNNRPFLASAVIRVGFVYDLLGCGLVDCTLGLITCGKSLCEEHVSLLLDWLSVFAAGPQNNFPIERVNHPDVKHLSHRYYSWKWIMKQNLM